MKENDKAQSAFVACSELKRKGGTYTIFRGAFKKPGIVL